MIITQKVINSGLRQIAEAVSVSPSHISRVVRGEKRPSRRLFKKLVSLGVDVPRQPTERKGGAE